MEKDPTGAIYIHLDDEVSKIISQHKIDLGGAVKAELSQQGFSVRTKLAPDPTSTEPDRELVLAILAGAAAASLVASAVAKVIDALSRNKHVDYTEETLTPALDGKGNAIRDNKGNPVYTKTTKPGPAPQGEVSTSEVGWETPSLQVHERS